MKIQCRILLIVGVLGLQFAISAEPSRTRAQAGVDDALFRVARKALPDEISTNEIGTALTKGLWNTNRTAVAVSFSRTKASVIYVFLPQTNGSYLAADASGVEGGNFGKIGTAGRAGYDRFETTPDE